MHHYVKRSVVGLGLIACSLLLAGCAGGAGPKPANYDNLPGSGDKMAEGPGFMSPTQSADYDDGVRVFSDDPSKQALINRQPGSAGATASTPTNLPAPTAEQRQDFEAFQDYQQYKQFQDMPKDSPEYQRFKDWQEWKQYQQWRSHQDGGR